jgi:methylamine---corrinoid protein Co-methyltransferase
MVVSFWDVLDRTRTGEKVEEKTFDMSIFKAAQRLSKEYGVRYDKTRPVPGDDNMADAVFEAGIRFYSEIGTFCISTGRVIRFTEEEIRESLAAAPDRVTFGDGNERITVRHRKVEDPEEPIVFGGMQTGLYRDEASLYRICKAVAEEPSVDGIWGGTLSSIDGNHPVIAGSPSEIWSYRRSMETLRRAIADSSRPGLPTRRPGISSCGKG